MALPTKTDLQTMDYPFMGQPFVSVPAKFTVDTTTMDYPFMGQPFVTNPSASSGSTVYAITRGFVAG